MKTSFKNTYTNIALNVRLFSHFCKDKKTSKKYLSNLNKSVSRNFEKNIYRKPLSDQKSIIFSISKLIVFCLNYIYHNSQKILFLSFQRQLILKLNVFKPVLGVNFIFFNCVFFLTIYHITSNATILSLHILI